MTFSELKTYNITLSALPLAGETYTINNKLKTQILSPSLVLTGDFNEYGLDSNGNGLYDYIVVDMGVDVFEDGYYSADVDLESFLGAEIASVSSSGYVDTSTKNISIKIPTTKISKMDLDGPYKIKNFELYSEGKKIYETAELLTTKAYKSEEFEVPSHFTRQFNDYGLDTNGNGLYDWLIIETEMDIKSAGDYSISGSLYSPLYYLGYGYNKTYLSTGIKNASLAFSGLDIKKKGRDGYYILEYLRLNSVSNYDSSVQDEIDGVAYTTKKYYNSEDFEGGADLYGYISYSTLIVNEENNINVSIYNSGSDTTKNGTASFYYQKGYCDIYGGGSGGGGGGSGGGSSVISAGIGSCNNLTLIGTKNIEVDISNVYKTAFKFTPLGEGSYTFILILNASNEIDGADNMDYGYLEAKQRGADLTIYNLEMGNFIVNQTDNLTFTIENYGTEASKNGTAKLYYQENYCCYSCGECNNLTLIGTKNIEVEGNYGSTEEIFFWEPQKEGSYMILLVVNATNEIDEENNYYSMYTEVKLPGADPYVYFSGTMKDIDYFVGETNKVPITVENQGTENATNINISLYKEEYLETGYVSTLIGTTQISSLAPKTKKEINFSWTPDKNGQNELKAEIICGNDVYIYNNNQNTWIIVSRNETDVSISYMYLSSRPIIVGSESYVSVEILNLGKDATNVNLNVYDNGNLIGNRLFSFLGAGDYSYESFYWKAADKGNHTIKAEAVITGDTNLTNNERQLIKYVYSPLNVTFKIKDSQNSPVERYIYSESLGYDETPINGEKVIIVPNLTETGEIFYFGIANFVVAGKEYVAMTLNRNNLNIPQNIDITSEFYNKTTQDEVDYYALLANKASIDYLNNALMLNLDKTYLSNLGLNLSKGYGLFYCTDFNFTGKKCNNLWKKSVIDYTYEWNNKIQIEAHTEEKAEAIALSENIKFDGSTTNLTSVIGDKIAGLTLEKLGFGRIIFRNEVNISRFKANPELLEDYARILARKINVDVSSLNELRNKSASLLFEGINFRNPKILYNGNLCPSSVCTSVLYNQTAHTFSADVTGFSEFEVIEGPYCGDGNKDVGETCSNCAADIGACASSGDGGEGGGGGSGGGAGTPISCVPSWGNCTWGPCHDKNQDLICTDIKRCVITPKLSESKVCFVESNCTDNDRDGYGIGPDCLGIDLNDDDPATTSTQDIVTPKVSGFIEKLKGNFMENKYYFIIPLLGIGILVLILLLKMRSGSEYKSVLRLKAKEMIKDARDMGYSNESIKKMFRDKNWKEEDINKILEE